MGEQHLGHHRGRGAEEIHRRLDSRALVHSDEVTAYTKKIWRLYCCKKNKIGHGSWVKGKEVSEFLISSLLLVKFKLWNRKNKTKTFDYICGCRCVLPQWHLMRFYPRPLPRPSFQCDCKQYDREIESGNTCSSAACGYGQLQPCTQARSPAKSNSGCPWRAGLAQSGSPWGFHEWTDFSEVHVVIKALCS